MVIKEIEEEVERVEYETVTEELVVCDNPACEAECSDTYHTYIESTDLDYDSMAVWVSFSGETEHVGYERHNMLSRPRVGTRQSTSEPDEMLAIPVERLRDVLDDEYEFHCCPDCHRAIQEGRLSFLPAESEMVGDYEVVTPPDEGWGVEEYGTVLYTFMTWFWLATAIVTAVAAPAGITFVALFVATALWYLGLAARRRLGMGLNAAGLITGG